MFVNLFKDIDLLYHFTTLESAVRILASKKIRFSKMDKLNDPFESFRPVSVISSGYNNEDAFEEIKIAQRELKRYQQISFSFDKNFSEGFLLNSLWVHQFFVSKRQSWGRGLFCDGSHTCFTSLVEINNFMQLIIIQKKKSYICTIQNKYHELSAHF